MMHLFVIFSTDFTVLFLKVKNVHLTIIELDHFLSYAVESESEIMPCIKIDKPLVVYRFWRNIMK